MSVLQAIIIAIVEGLTEFLPISSTAHMRLTELALGLSAKDEFTEVFTIAIQLGAIASVVVIYYKRFFNFKRWQFYVKLIIAVLPALVFGKLFKNHIDKVLEQPLVIATILIIGGIFFLFIEKWLNKPKIHSESEISYKKSLFIGLFQCLAILFPGLSRSAASILGGMSLKLDKKTATEFSFFLAVPTMLAATVYSLYNYVKTHGSFSGHEIKILAIGNLVAFGVALLAIKFFLALLSRYGFRLWGIYRILIGCIVLLVFIF